MRVEHDRGEDRLRIQLHEWKPGSDTERFEVAETFELADGIAVDVNEDGDALVLEIGSAEYLKDWLEAPIKHRIKVSERIERS